MKNNNISILLVDDEVSFCDLICKSLNYYSPNYNIDITHDVPSAITRLKSKNYDILITDMCLPKISGLTLIKESQKLSEDVKIIVITAFGDIDNASEAINLGASGYLPKPFNISVLNKMILDLFDKKRMEQSMKDYQINLESIVEEKVRQVYLFQQLADSSAQAFVIVDQDFNITYLNNAFLLISARNNVDEISGDNLLNYYPDKIQQKFKKDIIPMLFKNNQWSGELELLTAESKIIPTIENFSIINKKFKNQISIACIITDISEQKNMEQKLKDEVNERKKFESHYKGIVENCSDAIFIIDSSGILRYYNPAAIKLFGDRLNSFIKEINVGVPLIENDKTIINFLTKNKEPGVAEMRLSNTIWNEKKAYMLLIHDITTQEKSRIKLLNAKQELEKRVEERTYEISELNKELLQLNLTKDKFFSIISHDMKNAINPILIYSKKMYKMIIKTNFEGLAVLNQKLTNQTDNMYKLMENLLNWAKIQIGTGDFKQEKNNLYSIVVRVIAYLSDNANQKKITIVNKISKNSFVWADKNLIEMVLRNLISNAIKFTLPKGNISISSKLIDNYQHISIIDSGVGISKENISKLFHLENKIQEKGTSGEKGTGLGLILCYELLKKNNGKIWVEKSDSKGTTIIFTLPCSKIS